MRALKAWGISTVGVWLPALCVAAAPSLSSDPGDPTPPSAYDARFERGRTTLSFQAGYGEGFPAFSSAGKDPADARIVAVAAGGGISISEIQGAGAWYGGNWELRLEGMYQSQFEPQTGRGGGGTLNFRYNFLAGERFVPFFTFGAGIAGMDFDFEDADDGFNFILQGGPGAHWLVSDRTAFTAEVRWHHFSNAQTRENNAGINTALFLVGLTFFPDWSLPRSPD